MFGVIFALHKRQVGLLSALLVVDDEVHDENMILCLSIFDKSERILLFPSPVV